MSSVSPELYKTFLYQAKLNQGKKPKRHIINTKASLYNEKLVDILQSKMFKGYNKVKALNDKTNRSFGWNYSHLKSPLLQWEEYVPYPFEDNFNIGYKNKFLSKLKGPNLSKMIEIQSVSQSKNKSMNVSSKRQSIQSKNIIKPIVFTNQTTQTSLTEDELLNKIFTKGQSEMNNFSSLHFFAIDKNPLDIDYSTLHTAKNSSRNPYVEEEFLFKISHTPKENNRTMNSFYTNKGMKRGLTQSLFCKRKEKRNIKLSIESKNLTQKENCNSPKEQFIQTQINAIKTLPTELFKNFEDNLFDEDEKEEIKEETPMKELSTISAKNKEQTIATSIYNSNKDLFNINQVQKVLKPKNMSSTFYNSHQMNYKESRFNYIHNLAFTTPQSRRKLPSTISSSHKIKTYIDPESHLLTQIKHTNKSTYDKVSKLRDIQISSTLKTTYTQSDIHKLLNGKPLYNIEQ